MFYCGDGGLPIGTHFGPYEGHRTDEEGALESGYSWEVSVFVFIYFDLVLYVCLLDGIESD